MDKSWLQPLKINRLILIFILLSGLIAAGMNGYVRHWQYSVWAENQKIFYLEDNTPLFTTTDAPYFLGVAQSLKRDNNINSFNDLRAYYQEKEKRDDLEFGNKIRNAPLLSVVLSLMAEDTTPKALLEAGHRLIPITAMLTALMVMLAFGAAGYWLEGAIAAAGGGLSITYLQRSGAGRIDTDQLNLGFFYLVTGLVVFAAKAKSFRASLVLSALAGAVMWVFDWWYSKPFFGWAFLIGLVWLSLVTHRDVKRVMLQALLFIGLSGIALKGLGFGADSNYLIKSVFYEGLIFPNTFETITEIRQVTFSEILSRITGFVWLGELCVWGLFFWGLRHPATAIVYGPAAAFALLNFIIGNRAIFYSAPILWFGFAFLLVTSFRWAASRVEQEQVQKAFIPVAIIAGFICVWIASPTKFLSAPTFDRAMVSHFEKLDSLSESRNKVIASWWDYGYMSMLFNGLPTLHDGGGQTGPTTYFIAKALISNKQQQAATTFAQLAIKGPSGPIESLSGKSGKDKHATHQQNTEEPEILLVLTKDMANWMPSIGKIGAWDIEKGKPVPISGVNASFELQYENKKCTPTNVQDNFICGKDGFNLQTGAFGDVVILDGMVVTQNGRQVAGKKFKGSNTPFVMHAETGDKLKINMLLHRDLYFSVFHQLFYLNNADPNYFQLVYDAYPEMRVYKVL